MVTDMTDLWQEQKRIEEEAALMGVRRAQRAMEKAQKKERESQTAVGSAMTKRIVEPLMEMVQKGIDAVNAGQPRAYAAELKVIRKLPLRLVCLASTREALNRMSRPAPLLAVISRIGEACEDEMRWAYWYELDPGQAAAVRDLLKRTSSPRQKRAAMRGFGRRWQAEVARKEWTAHRRRKIGLMFVDYLVRLKVLEKCALPSRKRRASPTTAVRLTESARDWAKELADFTASNRPLSMPMIVPPKPWSHPEGGGFHFREYIDHPGLPRQLRPLPLVRRAPKEMREALLKADLTTVYAGLNAAQATAWRINPRVYSLLTRLMQIGNGGPGLVHGDPQPIPEDLPKEDAKDPQKLIANKNAKRRVYEANAKLVSKRFAQARIHSSAAKFVTYPQIYFAYNLDFRGRVYACSDDLSPQGNDLQRGLLEFAQGDPLDEDGRDWLLIHLANCYGVDKVSFTDRLRWAVDHHDMILACAEDPLDCREWYRADQPWQFLAACFAYADQAENPSATCRVPVMLDGSCSGIQHYAALLRDEVTGTAVNLVPGDKPGDLYNEVAVRTEERLRENGEVHWLAFGIDRKLVKRSVMVLPYGGTFISNLDYVRDSARDKVEKGIKLLPYPEKEMKDAFIRLAKTTWRAQHDVVRAPLEGMAYVRKIVREAKFRNSTKAFSWIAPSGLPVFTRYAVQTRVFLPGEVGGEKVHLRHYQETDELDWHRIETAAPPNFVHSLDATHCLRSLERAAREGITNFSLVHDAFGTTPTKTGAFARVLREEFARLYREDQFRPLLEALGGSPKDWPKPPKRGSLNTEDIARSEYLFA